MEAQDSDRAIDNNSTREAARTGIEPHDANGNDANGNTPNGLGLVNQKSNTKGDIILLVKGGMHVEFLRRRGRIKLDAQQELAT